MSDRSRGWHKKKMQKMITFLREMFGVEEVLFLGGWILLYLGLAAQFGHPLAQSAGGGVLILVSILLVFKGS